MSVLEIRRFGDPILRSPALDVTEFDTQLAALAADMRETMEAAPGVGLAAPQVGVPRRLFVFGSGEDEGAFVNPEVTPLGDETQEGEEGCLSLPGVFFPVVRAMRVRIRGLDLSGALQEREAEGFLARIFQHETDHLNGVLFVDRLEAEHRRDAMRLIRESELGIIPAPSASRAKAL